MLSLDKHRHHFVPAGYLRGFHMNNEKNMVFVYKKSKDNPYVGKKSVRSFAWRKNYYSYPKSNGTLDHNNIEEVISTIESECIPIIRKICNQRSMLLDGEKKGKLAFFIAFLLCRTPNYRDGIRNILRECIKKSIDIGKNVSHELKQLYDNIQSGRVEFNVAEWGSMPAVVDLSLEMAESLLKKSWQLIQPASGDILLTNDAPVTVLPHNKKHLYSQGPSAPDSVIYIPLNTNTGLIIKPFNENDEPINNITTFNCAQTETLNREIVKGGNNWVFSSEQSAPIENLIKENSGFSCQRIKLLGGEMVSRKPY